MLWTTHASSARRSIRRAVHTSCHAVGLDGFRLLGERTLDLSTQGMMVACDDDARIGEDVLVSFRPPGPKAPWLDAEAKVARIIKGNRPGDRGYCMGLSFTYMEKAARQELLCRLTGFPPPVPQRRLRNARDRHASVVIHPIIAIDEAVIPLVQRKMPKLMGLFA